MYNGVATGPYRKQQLISFYQFNTITAESLVCPEGEEKWLPLGSIIEPVPAPLESSQSPTDSCPRENDSDSPFAAQISNALNEVEKSRTSLNAIERNGLTAYCRRCGSTVPIYFDTVQKPTSGGAVISNGAGMALYRSFSNFEPAWFCRHCGHKCSYTSVDEGLKCEAKLALQQQRYALLLRKESQWRKLSGLSKKHPYMATIARLLLGLPKFGPR